MKLVNLKPEKEETYEDETKETPAEQKKEEKEGTETHPSVKVPEAFQKQAESLLATATKPMLEYLRSCIMSRESTLNKAQTKSEKAGEFDIEGMPS